MQELELVIFDIAGTTVEDRGEVPEAFAHALAGQGIVLTPEQIKGVRGSSKRQAILRLIPPGPEQSRLAEEAYESFRAHLAERYASGGVRAMAGAELVAWAAATAGRARIRHANAKHRGFVMVKLRK